VLVSAIFVEGHALIYPQRCLLEEVGDGTFVTLGADVDSCFLCRSWWVTLVPSWPGAWVSFMALSSRSPSLLVRAWIASLSVLTISSYPQYGRRESLYLRPTLQLTRTSMSGYQELCICYMAHLCSAKRLRQ
jgi:hypothetical protein